MQKLQRVLLMAGGTGGHVFPGLALASYLREQHIAVHWLGTAHGLESRVVPAANFPFHSITIAGLRGKGMKSWLLAPVNMLRAMIQACCVIKQVQPDVVIGMGGFASGPGGVASWFMRRVLVIHEQNAKAGLTNRLLAYFANKVLTGWSAAFPVRTHAVTVGNPVRTTMSHLPPPQQRFTHAQQPMRLLVIGGSLGAQVLNEIVPRALAKLSLCERPEVWHQCGEKHLVATKKHYAAANIQANLTPFIHEMERAYAWADVVLCRAGALTIAELCAVGVAAILIPYPYAADDHQSANATQLVQAQAALCVPQSALTDAYLAELIQQLSHEPAKRLAMAQAAYALRKIDVSEKIFQICKEICC